MSPAYLAVMQCHSHTWVVSVGVPVDFVSGLDTENMTLVHRVAVGCCYDKAHQVLEGPLSA